VTALGRVPRAAWLLVALALVVRLAAVPAGSDFELRGDSADYDRYARSIAGGHGYPEQVFGHRPGADRPPLYPYVLGAAYAVSGDRRGAAIALQALLGTAAVALIGLIAWRLWGRRAGIAALALGAVYVPLVAIGMVLLTETLFVALELGAVAAALEHTRSARRLRWAVLAGVLAGLAALTRGNGLVLLVPLAAAAYAGGRSHVPVASRRQALVPPAVLLAAAALTIAPWTIRNAVVVHELVPVSTETGYNVAGAYSAFTDRHPGDWIPPQFLPRYRDRFAHRPDQVALDRDMTRDGLRYAASHPVYTLGLTGRNLLRMAHLRDPERSTAYEIPRAGPLNRLSFWAIALLALGGAATAVVRRAPRWLWLTPALVVLSAAFVLGLVRLRAPADPFLILLASAAVAALWDRYRPPAGGSVAASG
jgi:hypothetical protein